MDFVHPGSNPKGVTQSGAQIPLRPTGALTQAGSISGVFFWVSGFSGVFDFHVAKLFGIKDFTTIQALDEFTVFVAGNDSNPGMFAGGKHRSYIERKIAFFAGIVARFSLIAKAYFVESEVQ